ncbi:hypothetical protein DET49_12066 [Salegentibacter sp. 24]|uniref:hypothetical protein n=1 Tax=Salegentibacter sp. 24 TaxID=2183986 RepID=UPI00105C936B|nr:hypothetical protein [Salegentibacter sp. 24]TDN83866.1 hypothetical protein DET49_12066 [Salegentibacter sp. 24]
MKDVNKAYYKILEKSLEIPGARINRLDFLERNLRGYCTIGQIEKAMTTSVRHAGISSEVREKIAKNIIKSHTLKVTGISTLSGMPGGLAMLATIPADLTQYYYHVIVLAQKLAYLYGYPQLRGDKDLVSHLTLFIGVMYGVKDSNQAVVNVSQALNAETLSRVPQITLNETTFYVLKQNIARWVGLKLTKKILSQGISKAIPFIGGIISGGVCYTSFTPMAQKLKESLEGSYEI